jgi:hypothetical protein
MVCMPLSLVRHPSESWDPFALAFGSNSAKTKSKDRIKMDPSFRWDDE